MNKSMLVSGEKERETKTERVIQAFFENFAVNIEKRHWSVVLYQWFIAFLVDRHDSSSFSTSRKFS